jgi:acyl dehydratase
MVVESIRLPLAFDEQTSVVDPAAVRRYAAATNDPDPRYSQGSLAPPTFGYVVAREAYRPHLDALIPAGYVPMTVQASHDLWIHRLLHPNQRVASRMSVLGTRVGASGTRLTVKVTSTDIDDGQPLLDQYSVVLVRGLADWPDCGVDGPDHSFPEDARGRRVATEVIAVDGNQAQRYADASGDRSPIHLDAEFARSAGLPGVILQGMCTIALTGRAIAAAVAKGDGGRIRRLAVRFSKPLLPGSDLETTIYDAGALVHGGRAYAFEASSEDNRVVTNGRAHISTREERG